MEVNMPKNNLDFENNKIIKQGFEKIDENFVKECDERFEQRLSEAVNAFMEGNTSRVIGLTGPSCSGKTTAAKKLIEYLGDEKKRVHIISLDDFFKATFSREALAGADFSKIDFDSPDTLDLDELDRFTGELFEGGVAKKPIFNFETGERDEYEEIISDDDDVYIFEGIQVLYPQVLSIIESHGGRVLCVCPQSAIEIGGKKFDPHFIRLCRRIVRDANFRASTPEFTFAIWNGVRRNEEENIFPFISRCDAFIDTTLEYEMNILVPYLRRLLTAVPQDNEYYENCLEILRAIEGIEGIDSVAVGENSLYKEFV
jgi:uridine kinase